jgi:hypothetical protein
MPKRIPISYEHQNATGQQQWYFDRKFKVFFNSCHLISKLGWFGTAWKGIALSDCTGSVIAAQFSYFQ